MAYRYADFFLKLDLQSDTQVMDQYISVINMQQVYPSCNIPFERLDAVLLQTESIPYYVLKDHLKPYFNVHSSHLLLASFENFVSFLIINSRKGACLNYQIAVQTSRLGQASSVEIKALG